MPNIVVIGGGGHAKVIVSLLKKRDDYRIVGYTDWEDRGAVLGVPWIGSDTMLSELIRQDPSCSAAIGVGTVGRGSPRKALLEQLRVHGFGLPAIVSPTAVLNESVEIGIATVAFDGTVINSGTAIGECAILNTHSTVDHDCVIGNYVHIAPGVTLSGQVKLGDDVFVGAGATVIHGVAICPHCVIGAGAVVIEDCVIPGTYVGVPARENQMIPQDRTFIIARPGSIITARSRLPSG